MRLDEILAELPGVGLRINNLFQLDDGLWRGNVREPGPEGKCSAFCVGATAVEAVAKALSEFGVKIDYSS